MTAFVLGNGISRADVDPCVLETLGVVFGCNALYRSYTPAVLVATDEPIARAIQDSGYSKNHSFYTRRPVLASGALRVPTKYFGFSSGPIAASLAADRNLSPVYLLGFDMGPADGKFNNMYAGSDFYKVIGAAPTFVGNWARQLTGVMRDYAHIDFIRVQGATTAMVPEFESVTNLVHMPLADFVQLINNTRGI